MKKNIYIYIYIYIYVWLNHFPEQQKLTELYQLYFKKNK